MGAWLRKVANPQTVTCPVSLLRPEDSFPEPSSLAQQLHCCRFCRGGGVVCVLQHHSGCRNHSRSRSPGERLSASHSRRLSGCTCCQERGVIHATHSALGCGAVSDSEVKEPLNKQEENSLVMSQLHAAPTSVLSSASPCLACP